MFHPQLLNPQNSMIIVPLIPVISAPLTQTILIPMEIVLALALLRDRRTAHFSSTYHSRHLGHGTHPTLDFQEWIRSFISNAIHLMRVRPPP